MDPVDALNEIAFWLERELAPTFKVQAFRKAARAIGELTPQQLEESARTGRLKNLPGVAARSVEVITQALGGAVPNYLANLRRSGAQPLTEGGRDLHAAVSGDLHSHSDWSDGGSPIEVRC
ncbi:MAG: putative hydrolase [Microbacteriaceae bacterium]|jgi:putative hydrolase|nr:putative hydrolase [Microbacteriaceae bacterium]